MGKADAGPRAIKVNRAPVLTLWATVVAERLGFRHDEALTLGRAVAGLNAYAKGVSLGLFRPTPKEVREQRKKLSPKATITIDLLKRAVPAVYTADGLRALAKERPIDPAAVDRYLSAKFGDAYRAVYEAMTLLARSRTPAELATEAYALYERFRPAVPPGVKGWGAAGILSLDTIRSLAR
ncbi:MAG: hypothetical protein NHB36_00060 [Nitrospira sp.]|nr:hypothetical protein [Nitrospira sp.]